MIALLDRAGEGFAEPVGVGGAADPPVRDEEVRVNAGPVVVAGHLMIPEHPLGIVVFAHGSGSSRHNPRNRYVAEVLNEVGLATVLFDLLTFEEERNRAKVSSISSCWRVGWSRSPVGWRGSPTPRRCRSATSGPASAPARPGRH